MRSYYASIDRAILKDLFSKYFYYDPRLQWLIGTIVDSFANAPGKGIPLGNQAGSWFAIAYLDGLDRLIKERMRLKYYSRCKDDGVIVHEEDVLAAWMELEPEVPAYLRDKGPNGFTASLNTAAWLHGVGELNPTPMTFSHPTRRQTRKANLAFIRRELAPGDIVVVAGIPATSPKRTVIDLIDYGEDLSLVANVLADVLDMTASGQKAALMDEVRERVRDRWADDGYFDHLWRR